MAVVFGAAMQKGGAGKSTTCVNLAAALADHGRTLLLDLDQQKTVATYYHIKPVPQPNLYHAMMSRAELTDLVQPSPDGFDMILADEDMAALEQELPLQKTSIWQLTLREKLAPLAASYDWIVLDFPPNLGVMAICGLVAAHKLIIPVPSKYLDWQALHLLLDTVIKVRHPVFNPDLAVAGVLVTLHDRRTRSGREIAEVLKGDTYAELPKFPFEIPYAVAFPDASLEGRSLVALAREPGATARQKELASLYHALAEEVTNGAHAPASA